jgi:hypothetical protein
MPDADENKSPLDALIELGLYAPLGLVLEARDRLPELIARGHQQVTSLTTLYRMMGDYSVRQAEKDVRKRWEELQAVLQSIGLLPEPNPPASAGTQPVPPPETVVDVSSSNGSAHGSGSGSANGSTNGSAPPRDEPAVRTRADLAIPGYDTLSASQVVQRLAGLSADELEAVRDYESGTRGRRTILSKIASLQSDSSSS